MPGQNWNRDYGRSRSTYSEEDLVWAFQQRDADQDGYLTYNELRDTLLLGNPGFSEKHLRVLWRGVDQDKDQRIDFDEFVDYIYGKPARTPKEKWQDTFYAFAGTDDIMDLDEFVALCRGSGLCDDGFSETDAARIFDVVRGEDTRLSINDFSKAMGRIGKAKRMKKKAIERMVLAAEGPLPLDVSAKDLRSQE
eukprot:TRINITY_DN35093_c0_g1_i1.p2 TRINITY_DN35093_c0_g1~~TRINITY_DN35093_c0_g1_i1.p2  ORF type:complete len:194 (+),score=43.63 TRINITY_DN35093_c0_g1_i1:225-806(+)